MTEAKVFEMMGRLHAENRALADDNGRLVGENARLKQELRAAAELLKAKADEGDG